MVVKQKKKTKTQKKDAKFKKENILVTCALPYVNNVPHIGNIAGSHLPGDIFSRFCKLRGHNCIYIGGSDEHGTPSVVVAEKFGISPKKLCDVLYKEHKRRRIYRTHRHSRIWKGKLWYNKKLEQRSL